MSITRISREVKGSLDVVGDGRFDGAACNEPRIAVRNQAVGDDVDLVFNTTVWRIVGRYLRVRSVSHLDKVLYFGLVDLVTNGIGDRSETLVECLQIGSGGVFAQDVIAFCAHTASQRRLAHHSRNAYCRRKRQSRSRNQAL